jgi:hypothetical protein
VNTNWRTQRREHPSCVALRARSLSFFKRTVSGHDMGGNSSIAAITPFRFEPHNPITNALNHAQSRSAPAGAPQRRGVIKEKAHIQKVHTSSKSMSDPFPARAPQYQTLSQSVGRSVVQYGSSGRSTTLVKSNC